MDVRHPEPSVDGGSSQVEEHLVAGLLVAGHRPPWWPAGVADEPPSPQQIDTYLRDAGRSWWAARRPAWTEAGWWEAELLPEVRLLMKLPKGPQLVAAVQRVPAPDGSACSFPHTERHLRPDPGAGTPGPCACLVVTIAAWSTAAAWAADQADRAVIRTLGPREHHVPIDPSCPRLGTITDPAAELVAPALRRSPGSLRHYLAKVRDRTEFPDSLRTAVTQGFLPMWQADLVMQDLLDVEPAGRDLVIDTVIDTLRHRHRRGLTGWTFTEIRRRVKQVLATLDNELRRRRNAAHRQRAVTISHGNDGWSRITADLPSDVVARIHQRLTDLARGLDDDTDRTMDQKRADVFADLLLEQPPGTPVRRPSGTEVAVVVHADTLLALSTRPAHLTGCGPIQSDLARALAADAQWRAWITDAAGTVIATSPRTYTPTAAVARVVRAREPHCRFPGCRRTRTDLDHVIPFPRGTTTPDNLSSLCRRHHNLKTHGGWRLRDIDSDPDHSDPDHSGQPRMWTWTDPTGITHTNTHDPPVAEPRVE